MIGSVEQFSGTTPDFVGAATYDLSLPSRKSVLPLTRMSPSIYCAFISLVSHRVHIYLPALPQYSLSLDAKTNDFGLPAPCDLDFSSLRQTSSSSLRQTSSSSPRQTSSSSLRQTSSSSLRKTSSSSCSTVVHSVCYNSTIDTIADSSRKRKRRSGKDDDLSGDDDNVTPASAAPTTSDQHIPRCTEIRRQRLEFELSRRDELRNSYRRLKDALPVSNSETKVLLLNRATAHIKSLELRVQQAENEAARLRQCVHFSSPSIPVLTLFFKAQ